MLADLAMFARRLKALRISLLMRIWWWILLQRLQKTPVEWSRIVGLASESRAGETLGGAPFTFFSCGDLLVGMLVSFCSGPVGTSLLALKRSVEVVFGGSRGRGDDAAGELDLSWLATR